MALTIGPGNRRRQQMRKVAERGWTAEKRQTFLETVAASCNVSLACKEAGMSVKSAYQLRQRDAEFAALWREALTMGYERLEERLLRQAGGGVNAVEFGEDKGEGVGEREAPEGPLDVQLALQLLRQHRPTVEGQAKRGARRIVRISREEAEAALAKRLDALQRRLKAERA